MENLRRIATIAVGALLIPAAAAQGATKDMFAGTPPKGLLKGVPEFATDCLSSRPTTPSIRSA
jgi:hypothetical protein